MKLTEIADKSCTRTKAQECQCSRLKSLNEAQAQVTAMCELEQSDTVKGTILLRQLEQGTGTVIVGRITGLEPGEHGFHIHEFGDLTDGCESAGGHYNPDDVDHGDLENGHVGDLGNVTADTNGVADFTLIAKRVDLIGERSVVGRSIVIHSDVDDLGKGGDAESLKTGNAGKRLACGVITLTDKQENIMFGWLKKLFSSEEPLVLTEEMEVKQTPKKKPAAKKAPAKKPAAKKTTTTKKAPSTGAKRGRPKTKKEQTMLKKWINSRIKERTSLDGAVLIGVGIAFLIFKPIASLVAYGAIAYGAWTIYKKED